MRTGERGERSIVAVLGRPPPLETLAESPAKSKCKLRRAANWRRRRDRSLYLSYRPAEPKRDVGPISYRDTLLYEFLFQDCLEHSCIRSFMLGCGCVFDYSTKAAQLSTNSLNWLHGFSNCVGETVT